LGLKWGWGGADMHGKRAYLGGKRAYLGVCFDFCAQRDGGKGVFEGIMGVARRRSGCGWK
jgi:hypothetical protein